MQLPFEYGELVQKGNTKRV